ncbi:hypothetical protein GALMADRAFT_147951 [Galerina marginata CBS 339.88]|uniref:Uncharacterized protein n=1 Tax=Galerina marginata (strain CBS 339.88) TaxID=685588 RepID=A0A067SF39_GALM3|nr:hypothetical protein GALMADRAFT_147951 [Galerina marginata CBS 339.88]
MSTLHQPSTSNMKPMNSQLVSPGISRAPAPPQAQSKPPRTRVPPPPSCSHNYQLQVWNAILWPAFGYLNHLPIVTVNMHALLLTYGQTHTYDPSIQENQLRIDYNLLYSPSSPPISIPTINLRRVFSRHLLMPSFPRRRPYFNQALHRILAFHQHCEPHRTWTFRMSPDLRLGGHSLWTAVGFPGEISPRSQRRVSGLVPRSSPNLLQVRPHLHAPSTFVGLRATEPTVMIKF